MTMTTVPLEYPYLLWDEDGILTYVRADVCRSPMEALRVLAAWEPGDVRLEEGWRFDDEDRPVPILSHWRSLVRGIKVVHMGRIDERPEGMAEWWEESRVATADTVEYWSLPS